MIDTNNLSKLVTGSESKSGAMIFETAAPLDDRTAVRCKAALISQSALGEVDKSTKKATAGKGWIFNGLITADCQTGDVYVLYNRDALELLTDEAITKLSEEEIDEKINKAWKKAASSSDLSALSGVFTFKGVATDISPDSKSIIIMTIPTSYTFIDILYDYAGEPFYKWQTPDASNQNQPRILYTDENGDYYNLIADSQSDIQYVISANKIFYAGEDTVYTHKEGYLNEGEEIVVQTFEALDGECIYFYKSGSSEEYAGNLINRFVSLPPNDSGPLIDLGAGNTDIQTFTAYKFEYSEDLNDHYFHDLPYELLDNGDFQVIQASSDNSGHVYQIGENEYASNGQIWVKLGSPVEDWIIL